MKSGEQWYRPTSPFRRIGRLAGVSGPRPVCSPICGEDGTRTHTPPCEGRPAFQAGPIPVSDDFSFTAVAEGLEPPMPF
jgi:hypothetical protein